MSRKKYTKTRSRATQGPYRPVLRALCRMAGVEHSFDDCSVTVSPEAGEYGLTVIGPHGVTTKMVETRRLIGVLARHGRQFPSGCRELHVNARLLTSSPGSALI